MSRYLRIWCKLNTFRIVKTCPFHFLAEFYGDFLDVMFPQFSNHFLPFLKVSLQFPRVFILFRLIVFLFPILVFAT